MTARWDRLVVALVVGWMLAVVGVYGVVVVESVRGGDRNCTGLLKAEWCDDPPEGVKERLRREAR